MEFLLFTRSETGEIYTIIGDQDEDLGELAVVYGNLEVQAMVGLNGEFTEEERDQIDLKLANFVESLAAAADTEFFQLNIYASENVTSINNFDDEDFDVDDVEDLAEDGQ